MVEGNTDAALDFMANWAGDEPLVLTVIVPEPKRVKGSGVFRPKSDREAARLWIDAHQGKENIYFQTNPVLPKLVAKIQAKGDGVKSAKTDIKALRWLHVDLDPRVGEDLISERARAIKLISSYQPPPTVVISSGGGAQGFWRLAEDCPTEGDETRAIDLERYSKQIMLDLHADPCQNIDRIMRLPGTINVPDKKKLAKGRTPALAEVVEAHWDRVYKLSDFRPAAPVAVPVSKLGGEIVPAVVDQIQLDKLQPKLREIIVLGEDPDNPARWPSRSEMVYYVACELVRAQVADETILGIFLDAHYKISDSIREHKRSKDQALRQLRRAKEAADSPQLRELNDQYAVIANLGGKCRIVSKIFDASLRRHRITFQTFDDFSNSCMHRQIQEGNRSVPQGRWWLKHPLRRQYPSITFAPERETEAYNLWRGFGVDEVAGDCSLLLNHIRDVLCCGNLAVYEMLLDQFANWTQRPDQVGGVAIVMRGGEGAGKGIVATAIGRLFGDHYLHITNANHLVGNFNSHLRDCVCLFADEAFFAGDRRHASMLKSLVTEPTLAIEGKGIDVEPAPNYIHLIMSSNDKWVVPASHDSRRYFVLDVSGKHIGDRAYFDALIKQLYEERGLEALLYMLRHREITSDLKKIPQTAGLQMQRELSYSLEESWWEEKLIDAEILRGCGEWHLAVGKSDLQDDYFSHAQRVRAQHPMNATALGLFLQEALPPGYPKLVRREVETLEYHGDEGKIVIRRQPTYELPALEDCRAFWAVRRGRPFV